MRVCYQCVCSNWKMLSAKRLFLKKNETLLPRSCPLEIYLHGIILLVTREHEMVEAN